MDLFREEVLAAKATRLQGNINLAIPVSWQLIGLCLALIVGASAVFLSFASYARTEIVEGSIVPAGGILQVVPGRPGRVGQIFVQEGQKVRKGDRLALVRIEEADQLGFGKQAAILSKIDQQRQGLQDQRALTRSAAVAQQQGYAAQIQGLREELVSIDVQLAAETRLVAMAEADLAQAAVIAARGFVSRRDLASREETLLSRQQQLAGLRQTRAAKASSVEQAVRGSREAAASASGATAALDASRALVERDRVIVQADEGYALIAPATGRIAALNINIGDAVAVGDSTMAIVPSNERLVARLQIPSKAAGFIRIGQSVRLALDAYPSERFGTVEGTIMSAANAPLLKSNNEGNSVPIYIVTASIASPFVSAYGRQQRLLPGMAFTARIVLERRSLFQWVFDPLFAAAR
jgi:membrane fusion protein